jgi:hypothetical protein
LLDRLDVPLAQSRISTSPVDNPLVTASRAAPAPTTPPPMTMTSNSSAAAIASSADCRAVGDKDPERIWWPFVSSNWATAAAA